MTFCYKVVPIIPEYLYQIRHRYDHLTTTTTPPTTSTPTPISWRDSSNSSYNSSWQLDMLQTPATTTTITTTLTPIQK